MQTLDAALPKVIKDRQERKAGYAETTEQITKWQPIVKANREAPTIRLTTERDIQRVTTAAGLASKHEATTDFEKEVAALLKAAGQEDLASVAQVCFSIYWYYSQVVLGVANVHVDAVLLWKDTSSSLLQQNIY